MPFPVSRMDTCMLNYTCNYIMLNLTWYVCLRHSNFSQCTVSNIICKIVNYWSKNNDFFPLSILSWINLFSLKWNIKICFNLIYYEGLSCMYCLIFIQRLDFHSENTAHIMLWNDDLYKRLNHTWWNQKL